MTDATTMTAIANTGPTTGAAGAPADTSRLTFGIDLGDRHSHLCALDSNGAIVEEGRLQTNASSFRLRFAAAAPARIAIEVGTHSPWVSALLQELDPRPARNAP